MVLSCFVICKWAGADASRQQALAKDCQDAKEKSLSLAGEAHNLAIMVTITVCLSLSGSVSTLSAIPLLAICVFIVIYAEMAFCLENNKQNSIIINIFNEWTPLFYSHYHLCYSVTMHSIFGL